MGRRVFPLYVGAQWRESRLSLASPRRRGDPRQGARRGGAARHARLRAAGVAQGATALWAPALSLLLSHTCSLHRRRRSTSWASTAHCVLTHGCCLWQALPLYELQLRHDVIAAGEKSGYQCTPHLMLYVLHEPLRREEAAFIEVSATWALQVESSRRIAAGGKQREVSSKK